MGLIVTFIVEKESPAGSRFVTTLEASFLVADAWGKDCKKWTAVSLEKRDRLWWRLGHFCHWEADGVHTEEDLKMELQGQKGKMKGSFEHC